MTNTHTLSLLPAVLIGALAFTGCEKQGDTITQAEKTDRAAGVAAPGNAEIKAIAEEGFIYGLPIVMNYAVMYENMIDAKSAEYKAPFNVIYNEHRTFTHKDICFSIP